MNPSRIFILRPVATSLLMAAIMLVGMIAYRLLPVSALPEVDYPTIQVTTLYPGASPDVMASSVTAPLEVQLGQMPGLNQMSSVSSAGASVITLQFNLSLSLDIAEQQVQAAINAAGNLLPSDLPAPPIYAKVNPADAPILTLALTSTTMKLTQLTDLADTRVAQKISQLGGVGLVKIGGGNRPALRIQANLRQLAAYGLNIDDLRTTIGNANVNAPKGNFRRAEPGIFDQRQRPAEKPGRLQRSGDRLPQRRAGSPGRCRERGRGRREHQNRRLDEYRTGGHHQPSSASPAPTSSTLSIASRRCCRGCGRRCRRRSDLAVLSDRTDTIRASVDSVAVRSWRSPIVLVVLVIFLFLGSASGTIIPSLSVPLSLVGTLRRDVSGGVQPQQSVADGDDDRDRLCRR